MDLVRDHYEGTLIDMTKGYDAGPFGNPNRNRPLYWSVDSVECSWERPVSTFNTAFSFIAQSREWLPDEIGGLIWFGVDDTFFTCYVPLYNCITEIPAPFRTGDFNKFSWDSAWWVFNFVSNYCNLRYADMVVDVQKVQDSLETRFIETQEKIDNEAKELLSEDKSKAVMFLTEYTKKETDAMIQAWIALGEALITKYNDGYIKNENGHAVTTEYPADYKRNVVKYRPDVKLPVWYDEQKNEEGNF